MTKSKLFSIITIACFASILCIPIGIVLMIYYTGWKKKIKIIITLSLTAFYAGLIAFVLFVRPSINSSGISLPFGSNSGYTAFDSGSGGSGGAKGGASSSGKKAKQSQERLPKNVQKSQQKGVSKAIYPILFFLFLLMLIIIQNMRNRGKSTYENPYVDTNKYKLPLTTDSKMPMVHFLKLEPNEEEKLYFATETNQKDNKGNLAITNRRVAIFSVKENVEIPLEAITSISSATSTVMVIAAGEQKFYIFMPENQMKYALAVLKWAANK